MTNTSFSRYDPAVHGIVKEGKRPNGQRRASNHHQYANDKRRFVAWDGEAVSDGGYCLLANSEGGSLRSDDGQDLSTWECLDFITSYASKETFHIAFSFNYDVNNILKDLTWPQLARLRQTGKVRWQEFKIEYIPDKIFKVRKVTKEGKTIASVRIDDVFTWFRSSFLAALEKYGIGSDEEMGTIKSGKAGRAIFTWSEIADISFYNRLELKLMVELMDTLRRDFNSADFHIGQWHGPGALASYALRAHKVSDHMVRIPDEILHPALSAYSGGWFERFKVGHYLGPVYTADINSAYAYAFSQLPSLSGGHWEHVENPSPELVRTCSFGIFRVVWRGVGFQTWARTSHGIPLPLFVRNGDDSINRPIRANGWYWNPEALLLVDFQAPNVEFREAWIFHSTGERPFSWVEDMYYERLEMKRAGNPAEKALKMTLASLYGRTAQRTGWDQKNKEAPRWHQIEWAGWVTSYCRSMLYRMSIGPARSSGLVSLDTDGITSTVPFVGVDSSEALGGWKLEEFDGIIFIQNGVYWLRQNGVWQPPKLRGIPKGRLNDPEIALKALRGGNVPFANPYSIRLSRHTFVGFGAALQHRDRSAWRTWVDKDIEINPLESGYRKHLPERGMCRRCNSGHTDLSDGLHDLALKFNRDFPYNLPSKPHNLPWLGVDSSQEHYKPEELITNGWDD